MQALNNEICPAIFTRKSTRRYGETKVSEEQLNKLSSFMKEVVPLFPSEKAAFEIQPHKKDTMKIAAYAKSEPASLLNLAFMLQQMDLFLQSNGMGAYWNATVRAEKKQHQELPYAICLIFGMAKESPARSDISEFNRKQPEEITNMPERSFVESVRLAPSARNRQPWYLMCAEGHIDFYYKKGGLLDSTLLKDLQWVDLGIAVCHAVLALGQEGILPAAAIRTGAPDKEKYIYGVSLDY